MSRSLPVFFLAATSVFAQGLPATPQPRQVTEIITITPDTVIATLNGRKFTAGELERISQNLNPQLRQMAATQPKAFLEQYAYAELIAKEAEKAKIDTLSPYRERLEEVRRQILAQGLIAQKTAEVKITPEEMTKYYEANKSGFRQATVKVIFISRATYVTNLSDGATKSTPPEQVKLKVERVTKLARDGGDFVALAKEYSDDRGTAEHGADLPFAVRANSPQFPEEIRGALVAAKPNDVVGPFEHQTGFYLFKVQALGQAPLDAVKADIDKMIRDDKVREWLQTEKSKTTVSLDHDAFWSTFVAANKKALEDQQRAQQAAQQTIGGSR